MATFFAGSALAGLAGAVLVPLVGLIPASGGAYIAKAFITVIAGGPSLIAGLMSSAGIFGVVNQVFAFAVSPVIGEVALLVAAVSCWASRAWSTTRDHRAHPGPVRALPPPRRGTRDRRTLGGGHRTPDTPPSAAAPAVAGAWLRAMAETVLETAGLTMRFGGVVAVDHVDFVLKERELRCLIGPNGAGKSTFFRCVTGLLRPTEGQVFMRGEETTGLPAHAIAALGVGVKTQVPSVMDRLTARENVWLAARSHLPAAQADRRTQEVVDRLGLGPITHSTLARLAHGERQQVELGIVVAGDPWLVLLDEPAAGMSADDVVRMTEVIHEMNRTAAVVIVEHDMQFIRSMTAIIRADRRMTAEKRVVVLETRGLSGGYGRVPILHGIDLEVGEGEVVGILGHNGMGKSTLLKTLMGFLPAHAGAVRYGGTDITRLAANERARLGVGYVPQGRGIFPRLSVRENLHFARSDHGPGDRDGRARGAAGRLPQARAAPRPEGRDALGRRAAASGACALSDGESRACPARRAHRGHPALDHRGDGADPLPAQGIPRTVDPVGGAEPRLHRRARRPRAGAGAGPHHRRARAQRAVGSGEAGSAPRLRDRSRPALRSRFGFRSRVGGLSGDAFAGSAPPVAGDRPAGVADIPGARRRRDTRMETPVRFGSHPSVAESGRGRRAGKRPAVRCRAVIAVPGPETRQPATAPVPDRRYPAGTACSIRTRAIAPRATPAAGTSPPPLQVRTMTIKRPVLAQMRAMAERFGMHLSDAELEKFREIMEPYIQAYDRIDAAPDHLPEVRWPRAPGYRPSPAENPLNAWYYKTEVRGAPDGPLRDKRIALKDTVCLAGVPMMNGSSIMEGYTPEVDATIVTRILEAGGTIAGKAHCENFCLSGGSHKNAAGPVHNPWKRGYMAGGSSSGSAALVAAGEVDMAIAGDQGGSIRIPSSNCGAYGMKPTHGLVPYTGIMPIEQTIDHVGPITGNVADNALFLEVLAGEDGLDPRQYAPEVHRYTEALGLGCAGLRIGVLKEGFHRPESEPDVDRKMLDAAERFRSLGARVEDISIEEHFFAADLWTAIAVEGLQDLMMHGNCFGTNHRGLFLPSMIDRVATWRHRADELSHSLKVCMFLGEYFQESYRGRYYGKAQNLMRGVTGRYLDALREVDLLLMPTLPMKARPIPPPGCSIALYVQRAFEMVGNTAAFSASGLPAMSIPCGLSEGLPIGMMLVGPRYGEMTIYRAAHAFEQSADWRTL